MFTPGLPGDGVAILAALASLGGRFVNADDPKFVNAEYLGATVVSGGADLVTSGLVGRQIYDRIFKLSDWQFLKGEPHILRQATYTDAKWREIENEFAARARLHPILVTISAVECCEALTGFGPPERGEAFDVGASKFTTVGEVAGSARPDDRWQGQTAHDYAELNDLLRRHAQEMSEVDTKIARLVTAHADSLTHVRSALATLKDLLVLAYRYSLSLAGITKFGFDLAAGALGLSAALATTGAAIALSRRRGRDAAKISKKYANRLGGLDLANTRAGWGMPSAAVCAVSDFAAGAGSVAGSSVGGAIGVSGDDVSGARHAMVVGEGGARGDEALSVSSAVTVSASGAVVGGRGGAAMGSAGACRSADLSGRNAHAPAWDGDGEPAGLVDDANRAGAVGGLVAVAGPGEASRRQESVDVDVVMARTATVVVG